LDTGFSRDAAGVIDVGTGAQGSTAGSMKLTNLSASGSAILLTGLPIANPHVVGELWNNGGVVTVSAG
jgi:hypothetical protein